MNADDQQLIDSFETGSIPLENWTQRTHVSIAYIYLRAHEFDEAMELMRTGVKTFNERNGIEDSPTSGYNETTTVAFLHIIHATINAYEGVFPTASSAEFCDTHPQLMSKHVLRFFYSPTRRMLPEAKTSFVEPDLAPLPRYYPPT